MKGKKPSSFNKAAEGRGKAAATANPFELKKTKTKFETLGRRIKGSTKNVIKAREESDQKRKKTLLVEYKSLRKANSFVDRRFGGKSLSCSPMSTKRPPPFLRGPHRLKSFPAENDASMTEDDRSFGRLQTQRLKKTKTLGE